jgi:hypothetical protein
MEEISTSGRMREGTSVRTTTTSSIVVARAVRARRQHAHDLR